MSKKTINAAIIEVLKENNKSLPAKEIYSRIVELDLYDFKAAKPYHVVLTQLRRHCEGLDFPTALKEKYYKLLPDGTYSLKNFIEGSTDKGSKKTRADVSISFLRKNHRQYLEDFKKSILSQIKAITPHQFEIFSKNLLEKYGFKDLVITKKTRDGGIDGFGKLKVGISFLNVAFQCKRWNNTKIARPEIDKFRGAAQGDYEQAILFTTSTFSKDALQATTKKGAIPVILIDGISIIDLMIEKSFGIEVENLPIYISALDDILF